MIKFKELVNNPTLKKTVGVASTVVACMVAVSNALSEKKKEQEFDDMKKTVADLKKHLED